MATFNRWFLLAALLALPGLAVATADENGVACDDIGSLIVAQESPLCAPSQVHAAEVDFLRAQCCRNRCRNRLDRVPFMFGSFYAQPIRANYIFGGAVIPGGTVTEDLRFLYTGPSRPSTGGGDQTPIQYGPDPVGPLTFTGEGFSYTITSDPVVTVPIGNDISPQTVVAIRENGELTTAVTGAFPGATFIDGAAYLDRSVAAGPMVYYYQTSHTTPPIIIPSLSFIVDMPNPSDGGMVGRNRYFENGSPIPRTRVFFDYSRIGGYTGLYRGLDINRFVGGAEYAMFDGRMSVEVRVPFAGTLSATQENLSQVRSAYDVEFGNVGIAAKGVLLRTQSTLVSAGLGISVPTASDSRIMNPITGGDLVRIENESILLQPFAGIVYAPNDRWFGQFGFQIDFDTTGNPIDVATIHGRRYFGRIQGHTATYMNANTGYWLYRGCGVIRNFALIGEIDYIQTIGDADIVRGGSTVMRDLHGDVSQLSLLPGFSMGLGDHACLSSAVVLPVSSNRLYDAALQVNFNVCR